MKRRVLGALFALLFLFLSGCSGGGGEGKSQVLAEFYSSVIRFSADVSIVADYEEYVVPFTLSFFYEKDGESLLTVREPDTIEGVRVLYNDGEASLQYDDVRIDTGPLSPGGMTPIGAVPTLVTLWSDGLLIEEGTETMDDVKYLLYTYRAEGEGEGVFYRTWFDPDTFLPVKAEGVADGRAVLQIEFSNALVE
ncbi:hypothetical protein LJC34_06890 [Oscillospiraceae bacterium OttesenSCG-928-G22]|nr:hypothetical protein [Oscillospiraceae bacterium OttesenSCG-928-G22]